ncbi:hypothetical protein HHI36_016844 [Cryptolaemus montrouzieri]|uniref:Uncharacterized protein n=1 Tax=Cryptolaemus montrouzieri TaxID=559131 RepID=A0ABD2NKY0_9CUCU
MARQLSDVLQVQFDKFKREMRNEYFEQIATLTGKVTELSIQHEVYVKDIAGMKMAVDSLRRENIDLRAKIDNNVGGSDIESFCAEANDRVSRCRNFMLLDVDESVSSTLHEQGNAEYAHIKHPDGRESTVSTWHLAPMRKDKKETLPDSTMTDAELSEPQDKITSQENDGSILDGTISESVGGHRTNLINQTTDPRNSPFIRRSFRPRRTPAYLEDYEHHEFKGGG